jgi:hypothetical protein
MFLLGVNAALFVIGMFIETSAAIIVLAPILAPVAMHFGIDPVHFGLIMVVNLALGMITPPFGVNLFAACTVARISLDRIVTHLVPFVLVVLACLMVITYVPWVSLACATWSTPNHGHVQRQRRRGLDLVEHQLHHPLVAPARRVVQRQRCGGDDQRAQQFADMDHAALAAQVGAGAGLHEHGAHLHLAGHADLVRHAGRHPHAAPRRHHPAAGRGAHQHHP